MNTYEKKFKNRVHTHTHKTNEQTRLTPAGIHIIQHVIDIFRCTADKVTRNI